MLVLACSYSLDRASQFAFANSVVFFSSSPCSFDDKPVDSESLLCVIRAILESRSLSLSDHKTSYRCPRPAAHRTDSIHASVRHQSDDAGFTMPAKAALVQGSLASGSWQSPPVGPLFRTVQAHALSIRPKTSKQNLNKLHRHKAIYGGQFRHGRRGKFEHPRPGAHSLAGVIAQISTLASLASRDGIACIHPAHPAVCRYRLRASPRCRTLAQIATRWVHTHTSPVPLMASLSHVSCLFRRPSFPMHAPRAHVLLFGAAPARCHCLFRRPMRRKTH